MEKVEEFIHEFHNLQGVTISEKKRSLFRLFRKNSSLFNNQSLLNSVTSQLIAQTHLERLFLVEFLIYYRHFDELYKEFLKGDEIVVSKIAKQSWFFQNAFQNIGPEFVTQVLPTLSYSLRLKILKKLVHILAEEQCDGIFDALHKRYGVFMATNILTSCSRDKIEEILKNHPIKLWTNQLKLLYKKDPNLLYVYFEERVRHEVNLKFLNNDRPIFVFIAMKNPEMYCNLQEKYKFPRCPVGKRTTKKIVRANRERIIARADMYAKNLNPARFVRTLGPSFPQAYLNLFPKQADKVFESFGVATKCFRHCPKKSQFDLFRSTFDQIFHKKLEVSYNLINSTLLKMINDGDEREKWAKIKLQHEENYVYLKYFKAQECIDAVKRKLDVASDVAKRIESVSVMTESCLINGDWGALLQVCQLLCGRFKNDDRRVHEKFLTVLSSNRFVIDNLDENHWKYIVEMIKTREFKVDTTLLRFKYFEFLHNRNDALLEEEITNLVKDCNWINHLYSLHNSNPKSEKLVLSTLIKLAPQLLKKSDKIEKVDCNLISACKRHYLRKPKERIDILDYPRLLQTVKTALIEKNLVAHGTLTFVTEWIICTKNRNEVVEELTRLYWSNSEYFTPLCFNWFLQHKPQLVIEHVDKFLMASIGGKFNYPASKEMTKIFRTIKCYTHLALDQKLIELCVEKLNDGAFEQKTALAQPLSVVMSAQDFISFIEKYRPTSPTVDLLDDDKNKLFQLQRYMLKSFINVEESESAISLILQFCTGDYVASCLSALYSCLYRIPEDRIRVILDKLCNTPAVSVKKHGYFFTCVIFDDATILQCLRGCRLSQAIAMSYQHFVKNPSDPSWLLFTSKLSKLDKSDHFTNLLLVNTPAPKKYRSEFFEVTLELFREQNNKFTNVLLNKINKEIVEDLHTRFFTKIADEFLRMHQSDTIFCYYLLCCKDNDKFSVIFDALRTFKLKNWSFRGREGREKLDKFVRTLFNTYMDWEGHDDGLIDTFRAGFREIFQPEEAFEEFIIINLMKFKNFNPADLSKAVADLNNNLVSNYGKLTIGILANCLTQLLLPKLYDDEAKIYELCHSLLSFDENIDSRLLVIQMLPRTKPQLEKCARYYYKIFDVLKRIGDEIVQVHLNLVFSEENQYLD